MGLTLRFVHISGGSRPWVQSFLLFLPKLIGDPGGGPSPRFPTAHNPSVKRIFSKTFIENAAFSFWCESKHFENEAFRKRCCPDNHALNWVFGPQNQVTICKTVNIDRCVFNQFSSSAAWTDNIWCVLEHTDYARSDLKNVLTWL